MGKIKTFITLVVAAVALVALQASPVFADPYGTGSYSECQYNTGCPAPSTPPDNTVPSTPETPPATVTVKIVMNVKDGDTLRGDSFTLEAKVQNITEGSETTPTPANVGWVIFYIDDKLLFTDYNADSNGTFSANWPLNDFPGSRVTVVAYDQNGQVLARADARVKVEASTPAVTKTDESPSPIAAITQAITQAVTQTYEAAKKILKQTPPFVAQSFPYWLFLILLVMAVRLVLQAIRETIAAKRLGTILQREQLIAEEKDNFVALSSHYLNTPFTVMQNGVDTLRALSEVPTVMLMPLASALEKLKARIDAILGEVEANSALNSIQKPTLATGDTSILKSSHFWLPVGAVAGISLLSNFLLGVVGEVDLGGPGKIWIQVLVFGLVAVFLYGVFRSHTLHRTERVNTEKLLQHEYTIDAARGTFIQQSTAALDQCLVEVNSAMKDIPDTPSVKFVREGYNRFDAMLTKFKILSLVQAGQTGELENFTMSQAVESVLSLYQQEITTKKLVVNKKIDIINLTEHRRLFEFVLGSIINNAIKFSKEGGAITIVANKSSSKMRVVVEDTGEGIPAEKLPHLFKPFSRAGSALQFDYEGLGFSLFLDKIIMDYLGGGIDAASEQNKGTVVTVTA